MDLLDELWRQSSVDYFSDLRAERCLPEVLELLGKMEGYRVEEWNEAVRYLFRLEKPPDFRSEKEAQSYCRERSEASRRGKNQNNRRGIE